jgi:hypothetical protein
VTAATALPASAVDAETQPSGPCVKAAENAGVAYEALRERESVHDYDSVSHYRIKAQNAASEALSESMSSGCGNDTIIATALVLNSWVQEARGAEYMHLYQSVPESSTCGRFYALKLASSLSMAWVSLGLAKHKGGTQRDPFAHVESLLRYDANTVGAKLEPLGSTAAMQNYQRLQAVSKNADETYGRNCAEIAEL